MKLSIAAALALATLTFAGTAAAQAADETGGTRPMGVRLETSLAFQDFNLVGVGVSESDPTGNVTVSTGAPSPHGDIRIGYDLDMGLTPVIGIGYRSNSVTIEAGDQEISGSASAIVLALELRYYLAKHRRGVQPFVWGEFNTSFVSVDVDDVDDDALDLDGDLGDHTALNLGIGAEYKFTRSFAVGGKWGLGFGFKPASTGSGDAETTLSDTTIGTSSAVYLAWRL